MNQSSCCCREVWDCYRSKLLFGLWQESSTAWKTWKRLNIVEQFQGKIKREKVCCRLTPFFFICSDAFFTTFSFVQISVASFTLLKPSTNFHQFYHVFSKIMAILLLLCIFEPKIKIIFMLTFLSHWLSLQSD